MDLRLSSTADADDRSESLNEIVQRVDTRYRSAGHLLQMLSNFPSSQSTVTTESHWRPPSGTEARATRAFDVSSQLRRRHEEYESFKQRFNRLSRRHDRPTTTENFSLRRRRDTRHAHLQNFDDSLTVITYHTDTNFTDFSTDKTETTQHTFGARLHQARDRSNSSSWFESRQPRRSSREQAVFDSQLPHEDLDLSLDGSVIADVPRSTLKHNTQESTSRPDVKGKGRLIHPPSPADKGLNHLPQTTPPVKSPIPQPQFVDDDIDDFDYGYDNGDDNPSTRSPRQPDNMQRDIIQEFEQDLYPLDNAMTDGPFEEEITGGAREKQTAGPSKSERNENVRGEPDDEFMDIDNATQYEITRITPGRTFTRRLIEEMKKDGFIDTSFYYKKKYGRKFLLTQDKVKQIFSHYSPLPLFSTSKKLVTEATDLFMDQLIDDLTAYSDHAGSSLITTEDVKLLMARQGVLQDSTIESLAHQHLPREIWDQLCVSSLANNELYPPKHIYE